MRNMYFAPLAKLLKLQTLLQHLFILVTHVPNVFTGRALEFNDVILRHNSFFNARTVSNQPRLVKTSQT